MELRRLLFERRLRQSDIARLATAAGYKIGVAEVNKTVHRKWLPYPRHVDGVRWALRALGVPPEVIETVPELKQRKRWSRVCAKCEGIVDGKG